MGRLKNLQGIADDLGMNCRKCKQPMPSVAEFCSVCGEPVRRANKRAVRVVILAVLGSIALVAAAQAVDAIWRSRNPEAAVRRDAEAAEARKAQTDGDERYRAVGLAKDAVRARLKAPDTAEFTETKTGRYMGAVVVFGTVTAKNAFGVPLRSRWRAEVRGEQVSNVTVE